MNQERRQISSTPRAKAQENQAIPEPTPAVPTTLRADLQPTPAVSETTSRLAAARERSTRTENFLQQIDAALPPEKSQPVVVFDSRLESKTAPTTKNWLHAEVARERQKPLNPGETPWYHLPGTGFWVEAQVDQFLRDVSGVGKEVFPDVLERASSKVRLDIEHFEQEYLKQMASLTFNLSWQERDGKNRIVCTDYKGASEKDKNGMLWESVTSPIERDGAVYEALFGNKEKGIVGIEERLQNAEPGTMAIMVSPSGWSGWTIDGKPYDYNEAQIYGLRKKKDGSLEAYTFRYDATIEENEVLQKTLGLEIPGYTGERDRIKKMVTNVAFIEPIDAVRAELAGKTPIRGFDDLVNAMQQSVGGREVMYDGDGSPKTFADVRGLLQNPEGFTQRHPLTPKLIDQVLDFAKWRLEQGGDMREIEKDLQIGLGTVIAYLHTAYRDGESDPGGVRAHIQKLQATRGMNGTEDVADVYLQKLRGGINLQEAALDLQKRPGCGGGGSTKTSITSMGSLRTAEKGGEHDFFQCSECGWKASSEMGERSCGGCGFSKQDYFNKYGVQC